MTFVSNDPEFWPVISFFHVYSYFTVACFIIVAYDWALTFGQEFELIWRQRWSLITVLYLSVRYIGILYTIFNMITALPSVSLTDAVSGTSYAILNWTPVAVNVMLGATMITWLHAMYQRSRTILVFLIVVFLTIQITTGVYVVGYRYPPPARAEEAILSGTHVCSYNTGEIITLLFGINWILGTVWAVLVLCLAVWITIKHFRELQGASSGWAIWDCFTILLKTHVLYFASFALNLGDFSPKIWTPNPASAGPQLYNGFLEIATMVQMFMLGPHFILAIREHYAKMAASSDAGTGLVSIVFQERIHISTSSSV